MIFGPDSVEAVHKIGKSNLKEASQKLLTTNKLRRGSIHLTNIFMLSFLRYPLSDVAKEVLDVIHASEGPKVLVRLEATCKTLQETFINATAWEYYFSKRWCPIGSLEETQKDDRKQIACLEVAFSQLGLLPGQHSWKDIYQRFHTLPKFFKGDSLYTINHFGLSCYRYFAHAQQYIHSSCLIDTPITPSYPYLEVLAPGFSLATETIRHAYVYSQGGGHSSIAPRYGGDTQLGTSFWFRGPTFHLALISKEIPSFAGMRDKENQKIGIFIDFGTKCLSIFAGGCRSEPIEIATLIENDKVYPFIQMNEYGTAWILSKDKQIPAEFANLKPKTDQVLKILRSETEAEIDRRQPGRKKIAAMHAGGRII